MNENNFIGLSKLEIEMVQGSYPFFPETPSQVKLYLLRCVAASLYSKAAQPSELGNNIAYHLLVVIPPLLAKLRNDGGGRQEALDCLSAISDDLSDDLCSVLLEWSRDDYQTTTFQKQIIDRLNQANFDIEILRSPYEKERNKIYYAW